MFLVLNFYLQQAYFSVSLRSGMFGVMLRWEIMIVWYLIQESKTGCMPLIISIKIFYMSNVIHSSDWSSYILMLQIDYSTQWMLYKLQQQSYAQNSIWNWHGLYWFCTMHSWSVLNVFTRLILLWKGGGDMEMNRMPMMSGRNERMMNQQDMPPRMMPPRDMNNQPPRGKVKLVLVVIVH